MSGRRDDVVFRGTVEAAAYLIDPAICGEAEARKRIIAMWRPAVRVSRIDGAYVVRLAASETVAVQHAPGLPLIARRGALISFDAKEVTAGTLVRMVHGAAVSTGSQSEEAVDPAKWIDVDFDSVTPASLGALPSSPRQVALPDARDVRDIIPGAPPLSPQAIAVAKAINEAKGTVAARTSTPQATTRRRLRILTTLIVWSIIITANLAFSGDFRPFLIVLAFAVFAGLIVAVSAVRGGIASDTATRGAATGARPGEPHTSRLRTWLTRFAAMTRLTNLIGRAHAKYLVKMLTMFDEGNFDEALRHAIPLGGDEPSAGLAFAPPAPRTSLAIGRGGGAAYSIPFGGAVQDELRRRYRDAFQRLDRADRIEEAAFVLAELLRSSGEAVSYLERKGRFRLAAEVAEARQLPADVIVRQWLLAGEVQRALAIARAFGAFEVAVTGLEKSHPRLAEVLRAHWAAWLAESGRYAAAVDAIWPVEQARRVAIAWLDRAIEQGGSAGARMLARRLALVPDEAGETLTRIREVLDDEDVDRATARIALANAICDEPLSPYTRIAARAGVRAVLRDSTSAAEVMPHEAIARLANRSGDLALRHDLPVNRTSVQQWNDTTPLTFEFAPGDAGASQIWDVAVLHEGRIAVAYGESGAATLARDGSRIAHFDQPAYTMVLSDSADRAIVIGPRGEVERLARVDFAARTASSWCDASFHAWAKDYDGGTWFASIGREILAIDVTAPRLDSLWHNPDLPAPVLAIARDANSLRLLLRDEEVHDWRYALPSLTLREREVVRDAKQEWSYAIDAAESTLAVRLPGEASLIRRQTLYPGIAMRPERFALPLATGRWHLLESIDEKAIRFSLCDGAGPLRLRATFVLHDSQRARARLQPGSLSICDDHGRVIVFDLMRGVIRRNLRL